jgi:hypothetical protein
MVNLLSRGLAFLCSAEFIEKSTLSDRKGRGELHSLENRQKIISVYAEETVLRSVATRLLLENKILIPKRQTSKILN